MATKSKDSHQLSEHPILAKLLAEGGPTQGYRGYVGASGRGIPHHLSEPGRPR